MKVNRIGVLVNDLRVYLPWARVKFTRELFSLFDELFLNRDIGLRRDRGHQHFISVESVEVVDSILVREIVLTFRLADQPPTAVLSLKKLVRRGHKAGGMKESGIVVVSHEGIGSQVFVYTFTSMERVRAALGRFRQFMEQTYVPHAEALEGHYRRWRELRSSLEGQIGLEPADFDLPGVVENALTVVRERASRRRITLSSTVDERLGMIRGDEQKVKQVLLNLLSNALKFTPEGGQINVRAGLHDEVVEVSVVDTGVGIAPADQEAVFEEFRQVGAAERTAEGTGLGLSLTRKLVELHGGRMWVQSEVGRGSTFTFTLPVRR
jgi:signal transduction histidine kinase